MEYKAPIESYRGSVHEVVLGTGDGALKLGGENSLPFHYFGGSIPNPLRLALGVLDMEPADWAEWLLESYQDVVSDPPRWARKCVEEYGADAVCLQLESTDPTEKDTSPEEAAALAKKVADAVDVPLIVYGTGTEDKDVAVLKRVAEVCSGMNLLLGPLLKENYEEISAAALEHGHRVVAQAPLDINLQKELHVKLCKNFPLERVVIDPLSPALGYGIEYAFSIMERIKQIGVIHCDQMMQMPILANLGAECWKTKEAKENRKQGILWEGITALTLALAGANILILRHPETLRLVREMMS